MSINSATMSGSSACCMARKLVNSRKSSTCPWAAACGCSRRMVDCPQRSGDARHSSTGTGLLSELSMSTTKLYAHNRFALTDIGHSYRHEFGGTEIGVQKKFPD